MKITRVGVDLAKNVFHVHGVDQAENPVWQRRLSREKWLGSVLDKVEPGCEVGTTASEMHYRKHHDTIESMISIRCLPSGSVKQGYGIYPVFTDT